jgi:biopolymer transport protein ExbB
MNHGGFVMWPLLLLSIISVTATVERTLFWIRLHGRRGVREYDAVVTRLRNADEDGVRTMDRAGDNLYADVAGGLLDEGTDDAHALAVVENQRPRLERFSVLMSAIITGAPMFGILGTVLGIIDSFGVLGGEDTLADPRLVSNGISEALIATATGLVVALITLFPYMAFKAQSDRAMGRLEALIAAAKTGFPTRRARSARPTEAPSQAFSA